MLLGNIDDTLKIKTSLHLNPLLGFLGDAFVFLNASRDAETPRKRFSMARASTMHSLSALHAAGNAILHYGEDAGWFQAGLVRKFDRVFELNQLDSLPENELEILAELDRVDQLMRNPVCVQGEIVAKLTNGKSLEFKRTPLKKFNQESLTWPPEYAGCVLALVVRFLNRLFVEYLKYDESWVEVAVGHHLSRESGYSSYLDPERLSQIRVETRQLQEWADLMEILESERWRIRPEYFEVQFLVAQNT